MIESGKIESSRVFEILFGFTRKKRDACIGETFRCSRNLRAKAAVLYEIPRPSSVVAWFWALLPATIFRDSCASFATLESTKIRSFGVFEAARCRLLTIRIYSRKYPKYSPLSLLITRYHVLRGRTETFASLLGLSPYVWKSTRLGSMSCFVLYIYICSNSSGIRTRIFRSIVCDPIHRVVDRSFRRSNDNRHLFPGQFYISSLLRFPNFSPR